MTAELRAELAAVRASRARIVETNDAARQRIERHLHDGPQQRLLSVALVLRLAESKLADKPDARTLLAEATAELGTALAELRELARGIYPVLLADAGLGPALASVVDRCAVPTRLGPVPGRRLGLAAERTCYFVVLEALGNAARHAHAGVIDVVVHDQGGQVDVEVTDDGVGGADPDGPGLSGLRDRVAAHGGTLRVISAAGAGTTVWAGLPCA